MKLANIPTTQLHHHFGAIVTDNGRCRFGLWAPAHDRVVVDLIDRNKRVPMRRCDDGFHVAEVAGVGAGDRYLFRVDDQRAFPDPASRFQPDGVHGPSEVISCSFDWHDSHWQGVEKEDLVIYELHVGTFTQEGTFRAAIDRLDELVDLGITAVELMPVADSAGRWNWGYDGVCLFAPHRNFGTPDEFRQLVDAAHGKGLAVILDVVYNHLGPEGNYLSQWGPYLSGKHQTVWGAAPNFDDPQHAAAVRRFFIANAIHWLDEYHIDALRVDAIHCMRDDSQRHIAAEMADAVKQWSGQTGRRSMLIAESNVYDPEMLTATDDGGVGFDAQWCDDFLHSVFAVVRPGEELCHRTYHPDVDLDQTLRMGYVYEGTLRKHRVRRPLSPRVETHSMIYSIQNHDFIGNHPLGKRFHQLTSIDTQKAAAALLILSPAIPMIFMGEEFACEHPFQFFVDFGDPALRRAVVEGRRREYPQHDWSSGTLPTDPEAFFSSKIGAAQLGNLDLRRWYCRLIRWRKEWRRSELLRDQSLNVETDLRLGLFVLRYADDRQTAQLLVRLAADQQSAQPCDVECCGELIIDSRPGQTTASQLLPNHAKVFVENTKTGPPGRSS